MVDAQSRRTERVRSRISRGCLIRARGDARDVVSGDSATVSDDKRFVSFGLARGRRRGGRRDGERAG